MTLTSAGKLMRCGRTETGQVYEQTVRASG
jgi:hypothetical protein